MQKGGQPTTTSVSPAERITQMAMPPALKPFFELMDPVERKLASMVGKNRLAKLVEGEVDSSFVLA